MKDKVAILMAVYNGEKYISAQIESILKQTYQNFDLIIRDDGSKDQTVRIIQTIITENPQRNIILLRNKSNVHGQLQNFSYLFDYAKNSYNFIMFSDQDDIWKENKVELSINAIKSNNTKPTLIYTNYLNWNMEKNTRNVAYIQERHYTFERLFVQNWTMGCTYILNKKMIDKIDHIPHGVENHDYWIALVAALDSNIMYLPQVTMIHRLHNNNVTARSNSTSWEDRFLRLYKEVLSKNGRKRVYSRWSTVYKNLTNLYDNVKIKELYKMLISSSVKSIVLSYQYGYRAVTKKYDFVFRMYLLLKSKKEIIKEIKEQ